MRYRLVACDAVDFTPVNLFPQGGDMAAGTVYAKMKTRKGSAK